MKRYKKDKQNLIPIPQMEKKGKKRKRKDFCGTDLNAYCPGIYLYTITNKIFYHGKIR